MKRRTAVIVDIDGTLVDVSSVRHHVLQRPKSFKAFHAGAMQCPPNPIALAYCAVMYERGHQICVVTARKYHWEAQTIDWLDRYMPVPYHGPFMRGDDDNRPDVEVKRDIFDVLENIMEFDVIGAIDDNPNIIELWKSLDIATVVVPGWQGGVVNGD